DRLQVVAPPDVPAVGVACRQLQDAFAGPAKQHRWPTRAWSSRPKLALFGLVVLPGEVDLSLTEEGADDGQGLLEPADQVIGRVAEGTELEVVVAGAKAED